MSDVARLWHAGCNLSGEHEPQSKSGGIAMAITKKSLISNKSSKKTATKKASPKSAISSAKLATAMQTTLKTTMKVGKLYY